MHEVGIAQSVLEAVAAEAARFPNAHIARVGLRIGVLAGVNPDALSFAFSALKADSGLEPLDLAIESCPRRLLCVDCNSAWTASEMWWTEAACPRCGAPATRAEGGEELEIAFLEVDDGTDRAQA